MATRKNPNPKRYNRFRAVKLEKSYDDKLVVMQRNRNFKVMSDLLREIIYEAVDRENIKDK